MTIEEETRLKGMAAFNRSVKLSEARERVCEAAVTWWQLYSTHDIEAAWEVGAELAAAAQRLAELEEQ